MHHVPFFRRALLTLGFAISVFSYIALILRLPFLGGFLFAASGQIGIVITFHDILSSLLIIYWLYLLIRMSRIDNPLFAFLLFFLFTFVEPYLLLGVAGAPVIRLNRSPNFYLAYPMALLALGTWLYSWIKRKTHLRSIEID
jgi:hypothetical protein